MSKSLLGNWPVNDVLNTKHIGDITIPQLACKDNPYGDLFPAVQLNGLQQVMYHLGQGRSLTEVANMERAIRDAMAKAGLSSGAHSNPYHVPKTPAIKMVHKPDSLVDCAAELRSATAKLEAIEQEAAALTARMEQLEKDKEEARKSVNQLKGWLIEHALAKEPVIL